MICKNCGQTLAAGTKICPICKAQQEQIEGQISETANDTVNETQEHITSEDLAKETTDSGLFEEKQHFKIEDDQYPYPPRSRVLAGVLQIFFGGFGIGRFYLGYNKIALGQLFTMPIFFIGNIWGIIDGILILCGQVECDANGVPLD